MFMKMIASALFLLAASFAAASDTSHDRSALSMPQPAAVAKTTYAANDALASSNTSLATSPAASHAVEMSKGKNHEQARDASAVRVDAEKLMARAATHAAEMGRGKSHEQARDATPPLVDADKVMARVDKHVAEMNKGKSHEQAREAAASN